MRRGTPGYTELLGATSRVNVITCVGWLDLVQISYSCSFIDYNNKDTSAKKIGPDVSPAIGKETTSLYMSLDCHVHVKNEDSQA